MKKTLRHIIPVLIIFCGSLKAFSQDPADSIRLTQSRDSALIKNSTGPMPDIRERLVQLAMQNPSAEIDDRNIAISKYNLQNIKTSPLSIIVLQGNLNEYSIQQFPSQYGSLYPRYNIGATIPLGYFQNHSRDVKIGKENLGIAYAQKNQRARELREAVLSKYEDYLMATDLLDLEKQLAEDVFINFQKVEKNFAEARVQSEDYANAYRDYNNELARQRTLQRNLNVIILQLERYIGVKLEDVLKDYK